MNIVLVYRPPSQGGFSIENLFHTVAGELRSGGETVIEYVAGARSSILIDLVNLWRLRADIYHVTGDVNYMVLGLPGNKTVLTIHDIGNYLYGLQGWKRWIYKWVWLILPIWKAGRATAVSDVTKSHIVEHLRIPAEQVKVINDCYDSGFCPSIKSFNADCPRILQVGTKPYKNVPRLIQALAGLDCHLVLVGELDAEIRVALQATQISIENWVGLSQEDLLHQYREADLVAFVSIGEGFGMPIIEAQAMGKPLITASVPPMSIVAGPGACLADPLSVQSIRAGVVKLIQNESYRQQVVAAGLRNVEQYSPVAVSKQYLKTYQEMARG